MFSTQPFIRVPSLDYPLPPPFRRKFTPHPEKYTRSYYSPVFIWSHGKWKVLWRSTHDSHVRASSAIIVRIFRFTFITSMIISTTVLNRYNQNLICYDWGNKSPLFTCLKLYYFPLCGFLRRIPQQEDRKRKHSEEKLQQIVLFWVCFWS